MEPITHTPIVYVVIRETAASFDGKTFRMLCEGDRLTADSIAKQMQMQEFERIGIVKRVAASQAEKQTKVTRAPLHK